MELRIFDYDNYEKDIVAQRIQEILTPLCKQVDGMWLYREPEMRTEGNELPTFTIISPRIGLCFIKAFSENGDSLTAVEDKFWTVDGFKVKSGIQKFRNYAHKIKSKLEDPIVDFTEDIPVHTIYVFPYVLRSIFEKLHFKQDEELLFGDSFALTLPVLETPLDDFNYSLLVSIIQNASIINKT